MLRLGPGEYFGRIISQQSIGPLAITRTRYCPGDLLPRHCHEQPYLFVMLAGAMKETALRRDNFCTRGWLVYNDAGEPHCDEVLDRGAEGLNIELPPEWLTKHRFGRRSGEPFCYRHAGPAITAVGIIQLALQSADSLRNLAVEESVVGLLESICQPVVSRSRSADWLDRTERVIRANYRASLRLDTIANEVGVHPAHLCREFRRKFGCTMTHYAARLRSDDALSRLLGSTAPLATIAAQTGFADQAHLTRSIRRFFGTTPGKLRRGD
jgi:AraC family transcriptional regulator